MILFLSTTSSFMILRLPTTLFSFTGKSFSTICCVLSLLSHKARISCESWLLPLQDHHHIIPHWCSKLHYLSDTSFIFWYFSFIFVEWPKGLHVNWFPLCNKRNLKHFLVLSKKIPIYQAFTQDVHLTEEVFKAITVRKSLLE